MKRPDIKPNRQFRRILISSTVLAIIKDSNNFPNGNRGENKPVVATLRRIRIALQYGNFLQDVESILDSGID